MGKKPNAANITHALAQLGGGAKKDGGDDMMKGLDSEDQVKQNEILGGNMIKNIEDIISPNPLIKNSGDKLEQYKTLKGDVITKVDTEEINITHRQYNKKDGTQGKQTITFKQINKK